MKDKRHLTERRFHMERKNIDLSGLNAGCSALSWTTRDGAHLWGRNYDFDRLAEGSSITFLPQETEYFTLLGNEGGAEPENACRSRYAHPFAMAYAPAVATNFCSMIAAHTVATEWFRLVHNSE